MAALTATAITSAATTISGFCLGNSATTGTIRLVSGQLQPQFSGTTTASVYGIDTSNFVSVTGTADHWVDYWVGQAGTTVNIITDHFSVREKVRATIKNNLLIKVNSRQKSLQTTAQIEEHRARTTLRDMLSEQEWRRYVTNGFIMVKGSSDYWYQIFAHSGVNVFRHGKKIHYICIHTDRECPPTDHVINMKLLVEFDEIAVWKGGNIRDVVGNGSFQDNNINMNLLEHYSHLKNQNNGTGITKSVVYYCDSGLMAIAS